MAGDDGELGTAEGIDDREAFAGRGEWLVNADPAGDFDSFFCFQSNGGVDDLNPRLAVTLSERVGRRAGAELEAVVTALWLRV